MDYSVVLDLLIDYSYLGAIEVLFRINTSFYNRFNNNKFNIVKLKEMYIQHLLLQKLTKHKYDNYVKLCAKYNTDFAFENLLSVDIKYCIRLSVVYNADALFKSSIRYSTFNHNSLIRYLIRHDKVKMIKIFKDTLYNNYTYNDILKNSYHLCESKEMYRFFRNNNVCITDIDIFNTRSVIPFVRYVFRDEDENLDKVRYKIWNLNIKSCIRYIVYKLEQCTSTQCINFIYGNIVNNNIDDVLLMEHIRHIGKSKIKRGILRCKSDAISHTKEFKRIERCSSKIR